MAQDIERNYVGATVRARTILKLVNDRGVLVDTVFPGEELIVMSLQGNDVKLIAAGLEPSWTPLKDAQGRMNFEITKDSQSTLLEDRADLHLVAILGGELQAAEDRLAVLSM